MWDERLRRRLKLRDLDTLIAVARWGSMAKAARHLAVSQPAVSKAILDMERTLGVVLLDRTAQGAEPTPYGRALLKWATAIFDDVRQGVREIEFIADPTSGELRVGATEPIVAGLLAAAIGRLSQSHPRLLFRVAQIPIVSHHRELRERSVDLVIGRMLDADMTEDIAFESLFDEPQFIVAGRQNPWTRRRSIKLEDLVDEPWTLPQPDSAAGIIAAGMFRARGLPLPRTTVICNSIQMHNALLATGRFLAVFPRSLLHFRGEQFPIKVLPVDLPRRPLPVGVLMLKNRTISAAAHLFLKHVREAARPMAEADRRAAKNRT